MTKKIMIIDDDPDMRLGLHIRLKANNFQTVFAADALSAISEARKHQPDLIILDLGLPAGDGFIVMERFRANMHLSMTPVIVVSARDRLANEQRAINAGAKAFMQKPVDSDQLLATINHLLGAA